MIVKNIIKTLEKDNAVCVNNLGIFKKEIISSKIIDDQIVPPYVKVVLSTAEKGVGFHFILNLSKWEELKIVDADIALSKWVDQLKVGVENNESVTFENFGTFRKDESGQITFESFIIKELNVEFEGLTKVQGVMRKEEKEVGKEVEIEESNASPVTYPETEEDPLMNDASCVVHPETEKIIETKIKKRKKKNHIGNILFLIVILISIGVLGLLFRDRIKLWINKLQIPQQTEAPFKDDLIFVSEDSSANNDNERIVTDDDFDFTENESSIIEQRPEPTVEKTQIQQAENQSVSVASGEIMIPHVQFEKGNFYVIAGSFIHEKDAIKHIQERGLSKYNPKLVFQKDVKNIRICIGIFQSEAEAIKFAQKNDKTYWILK